MRSLRPATVALASVLLLAAGGAASGLALEFPRVPRAAAEPPPELRSAIVVRGGGRAFVVIRLTGDLPRTDGGNVRARISVSGRRAGTVKALDRQSFRHYCFRALLRRPWPPRGRRVGIALRSPVLTLPLRASRIVARARRGDTIGARLGCRLPYGQER